MNFFRLPLALYLFFLIAGGLLVILGFDLDQVDLWLDRHSDLFETIGSLLLRLIFGCVLIGCLAYAITLGQRLSARISGKASPREAGSYPGIGCSFLLVLALGYLALFGVLG